MVVCVDGVQTAFATPLWAWAALGAAFLLAVAALAQALYTAKSTAALGAARHEERCQKRHDEVADDFRKLRREYAALADDVTADVETAALERSRSQAARARAAKSEKAASHEDVTPAGRETTDQFRKRMRSQRYGAA
jgi:ribulose kinase